LALFEKIRTELAQQAPFRQEGRQWIMLLAPGKKP
jgi:hypothetical protein